MHDSVNIHQLSYDLDQIYRDCWHRLVNGVQSAKHAFHTAAIASMHGTFPEIRTVVLRKVLPEQRQLIFHTDVRSPKIKQLQDNPALSWLFYDEKAKIQLRVKSRATLHHLNALSQSRWNESRLQSRVCYRVEPGPSLESTTATDGLPATFDRNMLTETTLAAGYENFVVVACEVVEIDWLFLNYEGHRRARFVCSENGLDKHWLVP